MNKFFSNPHAPPQRHTTTFYLVGDDNAEKQSFYQHFNLSPPGESQEIIITIHQVDIDSFVEIYDFPTDKMLRQALQLYFNILPHPTLILYFLKSDSTEGEIQQWVNILKLTHLRSRMVFVSDVLTYRDREKMIVRVGKEFDFSIV